MNAKVDVAQSFQFTEENLRELSELIEAEVGIVLGSDKRELILSRMTSRLKAMGLSCFGDYLSYFKQNRKQELSHLIDKITTNKTAFFREKNHFDFIQNDWLKQWKHNSENRCCYVWSAACSTGQEAYSLAMTLHHCDINYRIFASDISREVLTIAHNGIYSKELVDPIADVYRSKYLLKSRDNKLIKMSPSLQQRIEFRLFNLVQARYDFKRQFDLILCRNVLIYFAPKTRNRIIHQMIESLSDGGHLLMGHSEALPGDWPQLEAVQPTIYQKV